MFQDCTSIRYLHITSNYSTLSVWTPLANLTVGQNRPKVLSRLTIQAAMGGGVGGLTIVAKSHDERQNLNVDGP